MAISIEVAPDHAGVFLYQDRPVAALKDLINPVMGPVETAGYRRR
jgi:hypothetical protein